jgi:multimeric flavodoxin WrbA
LLGNDWWRPRLGRADPFSKEDHVESRFDGLRAVFFNGTLKRSLEPSNTDGLVRLSADLMARHGVEVEVIRTIDRDIAVGVYPDMSEHGWATDECPTLYEKVLAADILVLRGPIWLGDNSSQTKKVIERLYACSHLLNNAKKSHAPALAICG